MTPIEFYQAARPVLKSGRAVAFTVSGGSMRPFLRHGRRVTVAPCDTCRPGDIVLALAVPSAPSSDLIPPSAPSSDLTPPSGSSPAAPATEHPQPSDPSPAAPASGSIVVLHYVVSVAPGGHVTLMGAANLRQTETCPLSDIAGRLTGPRIGRSRVMLWHRLLPLRRYLLWLLKPFI